MMEQQKLTLSVVTLEGSVFEGQVESVVVNATYGDLGVFPGHAPLLAEVSPGPLHYIMGKKTEVMHTSGGILEVKDNIVKLLADKCIRAEDLDETRIEEARKKAQELLSQQEVTGKTVAKARADLIRIASMTRSLEELRRLK